MTKVKKPQKGTTEENMESSHVLLCQLTKGPIKNSCLNYLTGIFCGVDCKKNTFVHKQPFNYVEGELNRVESTPTTQLCFVWFTVE